MKTILLIILLITKNIITQTSYNNDFLNQPSFITYHNNNNITNSYLENDFNNKNSYEKIVDVNFEDKNNNSSYFPILNNKTENVNDYVFKDYKRIKDKTNEILMRKSNISYLKNLKKQLENEIKINENKTFMKVQKKVLNGIITDVAKINNRFSIIEKTLSLLLKNSNLKKKQELILNLEKNAVLLKKDKINLNIYSEKLQNSPIYVEKNLKSKIKEDFKEISIEKIIEKLEKENNSIYSKILKEIKNYDVIPIEISENLKIIEKKQNDLKRKKYEILNKKGIKNIKIPFKQNKNKKEFRFPNSISKNKINFNHKINSHTERYVQNQNLQQRKLNSRMQRGQKVNSLRGNKNFHQEEVDPIYMQNQSMYQEEVDPIEMHNSDIHKRKIKSRYSKNENMEKGKMDPRFIKNSGITQGLRIPRNMQNPGRSKGQRIPRNMQHPEIFEGQMNPRFRQNPNMSREQMDPRNMQNFNMPQGKMDPRFRQNFNRPQEQMDQRNMQNSAMSQGKMDLRNMKNPNMPQGQMNTRYRQNPNMPQGQRIPRNMQNPDMTQGQGMQNPNMFQGQRISRNRQNSGMPKGLRGNDFGRSSSSSQNFSNQRQGNSQFFQNPNSQSGMKAKSSANVYFNGEEDTNEENSSNGLSGELS